MYILFFSFLKTFLGSISPGLETSEKQADTRFDILDFLRGSVMPGLGNVAGSEDWRK